MIDELAGRPAAPAVHRLCRALGVSRSGYYAHRHKPDGARRRQDGELRGAVAECFKASRHTYGSPRLRMDLRGLGHRVGRRRIVRLMREQGLRPKQKRRFVPRTTDSRHGRPVAPQKLLTRAATDAPGQVWVADITSFPPARAGSI